VTPKPPHPTETPWPDGFDDRTPTVPDGTAIPRDVELEAPFYLELDDTTPTSPRATDHRCPRCETGVEGRGLVRITDRAPQPGNREDALRIPDCVATQTPPEEGGWRWCATQFFLKGLHDVYWGPERRVARLPPPSGVDRRVPSPAPREDDR
jgi:hypothetical protein